MVFLWKRYILIVLMLLAGLVGVWAAALPRSFHDDFPGGGRSWVAAAGPYSEHLIRDVGTLSLALAVLTAAAVVRPRWVHPAVVAAAWLTYSVPHLLFHLVNDRHLATSDRWLSLAALALEVVLPLLLLTPTERTGDPVTVGGAGSGLSGRGRTR